MQPTQQGACFFFTSQRIVKYTVMVSLPSDRVLNPVGVGDASSRLAFASARLFGALWSCTQKSSAHLLPHRRSPHNCREIHLQFTDPLTCPSLPFLTS
jgi:hypothetical protein